MSEWKPEYRFNLGDLVKFRYNHQNNIRYLIGIVVEQSYRVSRDNMFKILVNKKHYWQPAPKLTLLSKAANGSSK